MNTVAQALGAQKAGRAYYALDYDFMSNTEVATTEFTRNVGGTPVFAGLDMEGGGLEMSTGGTTNNYTEIQSVIAGFKIMPGRTEFFQIKAKVDDTGLAAFGFGLIAKKDGIFGGTKYAVDGVFFECNSGDDLLDFVIADGAGEIADYNRTAGVLTVADDTWMEVAFKIRGSDTAGQATLHYRVGPVETHGWSAPVLLAAAPDGLLSLTAGLLTSSGAARKMTIDYIAGGGVRS